jgi:murein DD-endopeptidase MepM/ murein hydrolase activator NlpD
LRGLFDRRFFRHLLGEPKQALRDSRAVELQLHRAKAGRRVWYLYLTRRQLTFWSILALLYILAVAAAAAVAPGVIGGLLNRRDYYLAVGEREAQGRRLRAVIAQLEALDQRVATLDLRKRKILLVYGLTQRQVVRPVQLPSAEAGSPSIYAHLLDQGERRVQRVEAMLTAYAQAVGRIEGYEAGHAQEVRATPSICPLRGRDFVLFSPFGRRRSPFTGAPELHAGIDLAAPAGTPVHAAADGRVAFAGLCSLGRSAHWYRMGNLVVVDHGFGFVTLYGHLDRIDVRAGALLMRGEAIGTVGSSGWSRNPHLHYELRRRGEDGIYRPVEPLLFILDRTWPNEEPRLLEARRAPPLTSFEPLPVPVR